MLWAHNEARWGTGGGVTTNKLDILGHVQFLSLVEEGNEVERWALCTGCSTNLGYKVKSFPLGKKRFFLNQKGLLAQTGGRGTEPETSLVLFRSLHAKKPRLAVFFSVLIWWEQRTKFQGSQCSTSLLVMLGKPYAVLGITSGVPELPPAS